MGLLVSAGAARAIDFDRGADIGEVIRQANALQINPAVTYYRNTCKTITLAAQENAAAIDLVSVQYADQAEEIPSDQGGPAFVMVPHETGRFTTRVSIERFAAGLYPWEKESFSVCALGSDVNFKVISGASQYKRVAAITPLDDSSQSAVYELSAIKKMPMNPDPLGIIVSEFASGGGVLSFTASDKWSAYYAGEKVVFTARVFEKVTIEPDAQASDQTPIGYRRQISQTQLELFVAPGYRLAFPIEHIPVGPDYGVSVSFSRIGSISTPEEVEAAVFPL